MQILFNRSEDLLTAHKNEEISSPFVTDEIWLLSQLIPAGIDWRTDIQKPKEWRNKHSLELTNRTSATVYVVV